MTIEEKREASKRIATMLLQAIRETMETTAPEDIAIKAMTVVELVNQAKAQIDHIASQPTDNNLKGQGTGETVTPPTGAKEIPFPCVDHSGPNGSIRYF